CGDARSRRLDRVRDCNSVRERNSAHPPRIGVGEASPGGWYSSRLEFDRQAVKTRRQSARRRGNAHSYGARCDRLSQGISQLFHWVDVRPSTFRPRSVESTTGAVTIGVASLLPRLSVRGAPLATPWLRFQSPLIEPDMRISR